MPFEETKKPRDYRMARLTRESEPYHFQRDRQLFNEQPRPPQPGIQPNEKLRPAGWGMPTQEYWSQIFQDYLRKRG